MIKEKINKLLFGLLIFLSIFSTVILNELMSLDEIWNYSFARNIANGLIPYKDFNIIVTPLISIICGVILKITTNELIIMRIIASVLCSFIIYIVHKLFKLLAIKESYSIIFTFIIGWLFKDIFCIDYNYGNLLIILIIIYQEIKKYKKEKNIIYVDMKHDIILGLLAGLTITIKHTIGIVTCIALLSNKLLFIREKEEIKIYLKSLLYRAIGIIIPVLTLFIYLILNSAVLDFINYTIMGISEFSNVISYKNLINFDFIGVLSILVPLTIIYIWIKTILLERNKELYILLVYGLAAFVMCFPISDKIHFLIGALPLVIIMIYEIYHFGYKLINKKYNKICEFISIIFKYITIMFLIYYIILNFYNYIIEFDTYSKYEHFKYIPINSELETRINKVTDYIINNDDNVIILDASASVYMIPLNRYNKDFDMFNKGNLGINGEERIIKEISNYQNTIYLVINEKDRNWQTPLKVIEYVEKNKKKIDTIDVFYVYR